MQPRDQKPLFTCKLHGRKHIGVCLDSHMSLCTVVEAKK